ncbi:hypothetical protein HQ393_02760 [Chitinibacter bivalviorum]|uniref:Uncharacterized protein n=1 Tax=Chitinibacter bivalviorum TaxID=2739434 RepID=A0A7H9BG75_9NEIS|nr:hypothetical protein [Chitinibacter bivalviorum]QLG87256.1 hypothetical protein HQ393_02760 [Chitinibacter bivalviorum]
MALNLVACGDKAENQAVVQNQSQSQSTDPRYQNPLLNANPEQFKQILADCGKLMFGEFAAPAEVQTKCKEDMKKRAAELGLTLTDANLSEQLVAERYKFTQRQADKK